MTKQSRFPFIYLGSRNARDVVNLLSFGRPHVFIFCSYRHPLVPPSLFVYLETCHSLPFLYYFMFSCLHTFL